MSDEFENLFIHATGYPPYPYQRRLANEKEWPDVIDVETGLGKTAAIILGWLYRRRFASFDIRNATPRRLIICLPTRVLVEQTFKSGKDILTALKLDVKSSDVPHAETDNVLLKILLGGDIDNDIDRYPEQDMIIIGTQDMLLSRALNRGYAMSKFRWPAHFAMLNNDCLWVMDEVQLMGVGVATSAQADAFRSSIGTVGPHRTIWMSATMDVNGINTVDHPSTREGIRVLELSHEDQANEKVRSVVQARKAVNVSSVPPVKDDKKSNYPLANRIHSVHEKGTLTLVILNTVSRAVSVFNDLRRADLDTPIVLLHSHYRPDDRKAQYGRILAGGDMIVISTQVVEAGADISAKNLITDLAPWPSMVQRFGRCNRRGEFDDATIEWIDPGETFDDKQALPYDHDEIISSRKLMVPLKDGSPSSLTAVDYSPPSKVVPVIRRKDLMDLFDTTADLMGNDLDVSRFVRSNDSTDIYVYWRNVDESPSVNMPPPSSEELCSVPIAEMKDYLKENGAWTWNYIDGGWESLSGNDARNLRPGSILLLDPVKGGYSDTMGWTGSKDDVPSISIRGSSTGADNQKKDMSPGSRWITLTAHTEHVVEEIEKLASICPVESRQTMIDAARWHDAGKAHQAFQNVYETENAPGTEIWGKGPWKEGVQYYTVDDGGHIRPRRFFRHELASALAHMGCVGRGPDHDLTTYIIAAHHGKVRTSLRSIPSERGPDRDTLFARGVWDGDIIHLPEGLGEEARLDLSPVRMGASSWTNMVLGLRDDPGLGPFRLSFLETVLRVADWRASGKEERDER